MEIYNVEYNDSGITCISIVDDPANEVEFIKLSKENVELKLNSELKRILTGVVLVPEQLIERKGGYFLKFEGKVIELLAHDFLSKGEFTSNYNHDGQKLDGIKLVESWLIEDPENDKSKALGFNGLPKGTWMISFKLSEDKWKEYVETKKVKGFSIEAMLPLNKIKKLNMKNEKSLFKTFLSIFNSIQLKSIETPTGVLTADNLELDSFVYDADGKPFTGEFTFEDKVFKTDEEGKIISIEPIEVKETEVEETETEVEVELAEVVEPIESVEPIEPKVDEKDEEIKKLKELIDALDSEIKKLKGEKEGIELSAQKLEVELSKLREEKTTGFKLELSTSETKNKTRLGVIEEIINKNK